MKRYIIRRQLGTSLVFALIALAVGVLLVMPMLMHISTSQKETIRHEETLHAQYTSDAGAELGMWKLEYDEAFRQELVDKMWTPVPVAHTLTINQNTPVVEMVFVWVVSVDQTWTYALWAQNDVIITKNNITINGDVHCGGDFYDQGNNNKVNGEIITGTGWVEYPFLWQIGDFILPGGVDAQAALAAGMYYTHTEATWTVSQLDDMVPGLHYCTGNVVVDDNNASGDNVTVVAEGTIHFKKNKENFISPYIEGLLFFSNSCADPAILIDGNKFSADNAVIYAPCGTIEVAGNVASLSGATFVADTIKITKNTTEIEIPMDMTLPISGTMDCGLYDIRSTAGNITTTVRVMQCLSGSAQVLSWHVD